MLKANIERMEGLDTIEELVKQVTFRKYAKGSLKDSKRTLQLKTTVKGAGNFGAAEK